MAPEPLVKATEVVPVIAPVTVIVPVPVAVSVSAVPETLPLTTMPLFTPVSIKAKLPAAVTVFVRMMAEAALAESVKLKLAEDDTPLPVRA
jgi:hypothetical protein